MDRRYDGVIFDVDGVLEFHGKVFPGAVELMGDLRRAGVAVRVLSNSTLKSRASCAAKLRAKGYDLSDEEVVTASWATARYLRGQEPGPCWVMLQREGLREFDDLPQDRENARYVVVGDYREEFGFDNLNHALKLLLNGAKLIVMISDMVDNSMGGTELTVGAYGRMLELASGVEAVYVGKPSRYVFDIVLESMGLARDRVLMVGDKPAMDIAGARSAGIASALVRTGEFTEADLASPHRADHVIDTVADVADLVFKA